MRNIDDYYNFMLYLARKERGALITADEAMSALDAGQIDAFQEYFAPYGINQTIHDALKPFRVYYPFTTNSAGILTYPTDPTTGKSLVLHLLGSPFTVAGSTVNEIKFKDEGEVAAALGSQLRPIENAYPKAVETATGFSIYPQQSQTGFMWYLRRPVAPVYGKTQVGRNVTYNPNTSTQMEWNEAYMNNIIAKSLKYVGINLDDQSIYQFAEAYNKET